MMLWQKLYGTIWLAFFACVLIPRWGFQILKPIHIILGLVLLVLTQINRKQLAALPVPDRLKRICSVTAGLAVFQLISGLALGTIFRFAPKAYPAIKVIHIVCALAVLAQASSVATAYDMWEEKEFGPAPESSKKQELPQIPRN
jgi:hypothetical protein